MLIASTDPFAADWYASEYLLRPLAEWDQDASSAARGGTFRSATRVNQNSAAALWTGASPYMDLLDGQDPSSPLAAEHDQLNVYLADSPTDLIFADDFESGGTASWSAVVPSSAVGSD